MKHAAFVRLILLFVVTLLVAGSVAAEKVKIEKADDLPRHTYRLDLKALELFENDEALMKLAGEVKADLLADLDTYEIPDKTTIKEFYGVLGTISMLEKNYDDYLKFNGLIRDLEEKEALRLTIGLFSRAYIAAVKAGDEDQMAAFKREYAALVNSLPYEAVEAEMKSSKARAEMLTYNLIAGIIETRVQPTLDQANGEMSKDLAMRVLGANYSTRNYIPHTAAIVEVLTAYLDAHKVVKEDIWAEREVVLDEGSKGNPVVVTIWDSGLDTDIFAGQLWVNDKEVAGNGVDDDNNGFVDDVHGMAYTLHADKTPELLYPIGDVEADRTRLQRQMKGLTDMTANIDSDQATEVKKRLGSLEQAAVRPFIEDIAKYGNYCHGTHVGGIAARGNPFVRLMASRITFGYKMIPECPTLEQARKDSVAVVETFDYFKKYGVRVVNMSWGGDLASIESALEANNSGGTPEERKALAREIFEIGKQSLYQGIKDAPQILFVTSAGNSDNDVTFDEVIPSTFDLPNIMSVGAVDQAGDETGFTSFGKVDVYANGYEVLSYVPGGDEMNLSGTSQASPNVTNLAGKLLAVNPNLTTLQVRELIENGCDEKQVGDRAVRLINPKRSVELLEQMQ